jgi:hypothetical protein
MVYKFTDYVIFLSLIILFQIKIFGFPFFIIIIVVNLIIPFFLDEDISFPKLNNLLYFVNQGLFVDVKRNKFRMKVLDREVVVYLKKLNFTFADIYMDKNVSEIEQNSFGCLIKNQNKAKAKTEYYSNNILIDYLIKIHPVFVNIMSINFNLIKNNFNYAHFLKKIVNKQTNNKITINMLINYMYNANLGSKICNIKEINNKVYKAMNNSTLQVEDCNQDIFCHNVSEFLKFKKIKNYNLILSEIGLVRNDTQYDNLNLNQRKDLINTMYNQYIEIEPIKNKVKKQICYNYINIIVIFITEIMSTIAPIYYITIPLLGLNMYIWYRSR